MRLCRKSVHVRKLQRESDGRKEWEKTLHTIHHSSFPFQSSCFLLFQCVIVAWREPHAQVDEGGEQGCYKEEKDLEKMSRNEKD